MTDPERPSDRPTDGALAEAGTGAPPATEAEPGTPTASGLVIPIASGPVIPTASDPGASGTPSSEEYSVAFSPRQMAVGFVIIAGLIALGLRRRRNRRASANPKADMDD